MSSHKPSRKNPPSFSPIAFDEDDLVSVIMNLGVDAKRIDIRDVLLNIAKEMVSSSSEPKVKTKPKTKSNQKSVDDARWVAANEQVEIAGFVIKGGLFYLGEKLRTHKKDEPSLINPNLTVTKPHSRSTTVENDYYYQTREYSALSPNERWQFLNWLAQERQAQAEKIQYVLLFLMGLERRILLEWEACLTTGEITIIAQELRRLWTIYQKNYLLKERITNLLDYVEALSYRQQLQPVPPQKIEGLSYFSFALRVGLGQIAKNKQPLTVQWALAWFRADSRIDKPSSAQRFPELFDQLYVQQYQQHYESGFLLPINKTTLCFSYYPISPVIKNEFRDELTGVCDMAVTRAPLKKLSHIAYLCHEILQPYARFLARTNKSPDALEAALLLPSALWPKTMLAELEALRLSLEHTPRITTLIDISLPLLSESHLAPSQVLGLVKALETCGIGLEPDIFAIDSTLKLTTIEPVVLFNTLADDSSTRLMPVYIAASLTVDLAVFIAQHAKLDHAVFNSWMQQGIESWTHLKAVHRQRLTARVLSRWHKSSSSLAMFKKRFALLTDTMRQPIAQFLAQVAQSQGMAQPSTIKQLERIYSALQVDNQQLYANLHFSSSTIIKVQATPNTKTSISFSLDSSKIAQLQQETAQVSALLAQVFVEDEDVLDNSTTAINLMPITAIDCLFGLDVSHSAFLRQVALRLLWTRAELLAIATQCDLMLDGALEYINEVALDTWDEPLFDGDDPIHINPDLIEKFFA